MSNFNTNTLTSDQVATMPGFDPSQHIGVLGQAPNVRPLTQTDYDALDDDTRMKVQLLAEQLDVQKQRQQVGEATISKKVVEEQVNVPVSLQHEEVIIHKVNPTGAMTGTIGDGQTINVPLSEEVAKVSKTTRVAGEVEIEKRVTSEQKTITDTLRHEEIDVNQGTTGRVTVQDDTKKQ